MKRKRDYGKLQMMVRRWRERNPDKIKAQRMVFVALRNGTMKRYPCNVCAEPKSEAHHDDYSKPLDVSWLCKKCHGKADMERRRREKGL